MNARDAEPDHHVKKNRELATAYFEPLRLGKRRQLSSLHQETTR